VSSFTREAISMGSTIAEAPPIGKGGSGGAARESARFSISKKRFTGEQVPFYPQEKSRRGEEVRDESSGGL
jgi:hypothetical protein